MKARRRRLLQAGLVSAGAALVRLSLAQSAAPRTIALTARRYAYEPREIALKAGERVVVLIRSLDFAHGMNIPDLGQRLDLLPGLLTRLELQPAAPGVIEFVCDNFCGEGHEEMHGRFVVSA